MEKINVFSIVFNNDERCFETSVMRNVNVSDYDEYTNVVSVPMISESCKVDVVKITDTAGYLMTRMNMSDYDGLSKVLDAFKEHCTSAIKANYDKLSHLEAVSILG